MKILLAVLALAFIISGCMSPPGATTGNVVRDDLDTSQDTNSREMPDGSVNEDTAELRQCDEAINYQVLIDALPENVNGYELGEPQGNMMSWTDPETKNTMRYSTATASLTKDDKYITLSMTDTCYIQYLSMAWVGFYETEGTTGYLKRANIDGNPGWHQFDKASNMYSYTLFVDERVIVSVQGGRDVPDSDVEAAVNAIDYSSIASAS